MTILEELAESARERVKAAKAAVSAQELRRRAEALDRGEFAFENALEQPGLSCICACK